MISSSNSSSNSFVSPRNGVTEAVDVQAHEQHMHSFNTHHTIDIAIFSPGSIFKKSRLLLTLSRNKGITKEHKKPIVDHRVSGQPTQKTQDSVDNISNYSTTMMIYLFSDVGHIMEGGSLIIFAF